MLSRGGPQATPPVATPSERKGIMLQTESEKKTTLFRVLMILWLLIAMIILMG